MYQKIISIQSLLTSYLPSETHSLLCWWQAVEVMLRRCRHSWNMMLMWRLLTRMTRRLCIGAVKRAMRKPLRLGQ